MLLQLYTDNSTFISNDALVGAFKIVEQAIQATLWLFQNELGESEYLKKKRKILEYIARQGGKVSWRKLSQSRILPNGSDDYKHILESMGDSGEIAINGEWNKKKDIEIILI